MLSMHSLQALSVKLWSLCFLMVFSTALLAADSISDKVRHRFEHMLAGYPMVAAERPLQTGPTLLEFYEARHFELAWFEGGQLRPEARDLLRTVDRSAGEGLQPTDYHQHTIARLIGGFTPTSPIETQVDLDLLLSDAFLLLGSHLLSGKVNPETLTPEWSARRPGQDMDALLVQALEAGSVEAMLDTLRPSQPGYHRLREERKRFADLAALGDWQPIPTGPLIRPGNSDSRLEAIRNRLVALGDHAPIAVALDPETEADANRQTYDIELLAAVSRLQARHGLKADGVIGPDTISVLNISPEQRLQQIGTSMERWRWLPEQMGERHVLVNMAAPELQVIAEHKPIFKTGLAVGQACQQVPAFSDEIRYFVFNPSWTVPPALLVKGELAKFADRERLQTLGLSVYQHTESGRRKLDPGTVDWSTVPEGGLPFQIVQEPGPQNALGEVKIMFPNRRGVYLHDMPSAVPANTFNQPFDYGCMRVEKPLDLADLLLGKEQGWSRRFARDGGSGGSETVYLHEPLPIHIQYLTAWADENGILQLRRDTLDRDPALMEALASHPQGTAAR